jgi:hypothetical protein|nr:MAG TPA: hypothetical protein [Caudoviricetes sp.]
MAKKEKAKATKNNKKEKNKKYSKKAKEDKKTKKTEKKEELKYDYEVKCLLIYQLKKGDLIELISNEISTICQIVEISDISDFVMTLKVRVINNSSDINKNNAEIKQIEKSENKKGKTVQTKRKGKKK